MYNSNPCSLILIDNSFADEILVVDSFSKDGSYEKAKELSFQIIEKGEKNPWIIKIPKIFPINIIVRWSIKY